MARHRGKKRNFMSGVSVNPKSGVTLPEEVEMSRGQGGVVSLGKMGVGWMGRETGVRAPHAHGSMVSPGKRAGGEDAVGVEVPKGFEMPQVQGDMVSLGKREVEWMRGATRVEPIGLMRRESMPGWRNTVGGSNGREVVHTTFDAMGTRSGMGGRIPRQLWMKQRDSVWWEEVSSRQCPADEFKRLFRMSRATFDMLCRQLAVTITNRENPLHKAIPLRKRIAVCIWHLASGEPLHQVSVRFDLEISTCHKISLEVCTAILDFLMVKYLVWPEHPSAVVITNQFEPAYGIPNVIGAIYNTHIPIMAPSSDTALYDKHHLVGHMKKPSYSIRLQAVVDGRGSFINFCIGYPGSMSDEDVLRKSMVSTHHSSLIQAQGMWLLGGSSYLVKDWLLTPYTDTNLTRVQRLFNEKVVGARVVAKDAIMRLKARWKILQKCNDNIDLQYFPFMVSACCVLHNICEQNGDTLDPQLVFDHAEDEMLAGKPVHSDAASLVRDNVANNLIIREKSIRISSSL